MNKLTQSVLVASLLLAGCSQISSPDFSSQMSAPVTSQATLLPVRSDIHQGTLANGMKYIVLPNAEPADRVSLQLIVHAGSLDEADDQQGIAHLVEHMAFNGTEQFPGNSIIEHQESLGMVFGRDVNAMTEYYTTSYYLHLPDNSERMLNEAFNMFSQQASALTFDQQELEKERPVVEEEWRRGLNMMARLGTANRRITLAGSRFGDREPIGDMDLVRNIGTDRIKAFYQDWYQPNNMTLLVVGSVEASQIEALLNKYFAPMPARDLPARPDLTVPLPEMLTFDTIQDNEITTEVLSINLRGSQAVVYTEDDLKAELLNTLSMTMMDNRLHVQYQSETDTISKMVASAMPLASGYSNNRVMAILKDGQYLSAMEEMFSEVSRYATHGFSQRDLDTARNSISARYRTIADGLEGARNSRQMMRLFNQIRTGQPLVHWSDDNETVQRLLASITVEDVNLHFRQVVHQRAPLVIAQVNTSHGNAQPPAKKIEQLWEKALANPPAAVDQQIIPDKLFTRTPDATKVVKHQQFGEIQKWTLANGAQIWFQYSDEVSNQVQLRWQGYGGTMQLPQSERRAATLAARNLSAFGYGGFDSEALGVINASHNIRQFPYVDLSSQGVFGTTSKDAVEQWLQNLNLMLTKPQVDKEVWQAKQDFIVRSLERRKDNPSSQFNEKIDRLRYVNTPSIQPITADELRAITPEQLLAAYKTIFGTANGHQLVVIGDIKADRVIDLASRYLGHLPAGQSHHEPSLPKLAGGRHRVLVEGGAEPQGITSVLFNADYPFSDEAEYKAYLLSRIVSTRMREQLREKAGGVYTARFGISLERSRQQAYGMISYSHQPERADELKDMALNIIAEIAANGVTQDELSTVRKQIIRGLQPEAISYHDRYRWLTQMAADDQYQELPGSYLNWLKDVTPADLQPMASTILSTNNVIDALLLPEKKS
ncbi:M16 family metallopeptidase [Endozoicomonas euniceicola]|uniref:Insulinase family protein n=1 Tax=Endozoicomonas euniceicola TaxID=1234143 RepID=A0ABY6GP12_9GAMM|nr:M16 family metallopeptidase [Endozoicomonas euniceicola]UYM14480.1 insulinase family protein [Endozoicomonas euniceicola]